MKPIRAPAFLRALIAQLAAIALAGLVIVLWPARAIEPEAKAAEEEKDRPKPEPPEKVERVVVVKVERVAALPQMIAPKMIAKNEPLPPKVERPQPVEPAPKQEPPRQQTPAPEERPRQQTPAQRSKPALSKPAPRQTAPQRAELADVSGVPLRVLVPSSPHELERYLDRSQSCLLISRVDGDRAEVIESLDLSAGRTAPSRRPPCSGVPRVIRDRALIDALGDPIARTRQTHATRASDELVMQIVLPASLVGAAENAAKKRLGNAAPAELARRAAAAGYEIRCFAKTDGTLACI